jgi:MFS family permease
MSRLVRETAEALRLAFSNPGIRRLELAWLLGIAADSALLVVLLVVVYADAGAVATGLLGAFRMVPAILSGMFASAALERFRGERLLLTVGLIRAIGGVLCAFLIATGGPIPVLFVLAAIVAAAGAPVRPTASTLMPGLARSPRELVAANMAWTTAEGVGAFSGPLMAGLLMAAGQTALAALFAGLAFLGMAIVVGGLTFENAEDAWGGAGGTSRGLRFSEGLRALRARPVLGWSMIGLYGQVATRGLLNSFAVVASIELLGMGDAGVGLLSSALGLGGLFGAVFAVSQARPDQLVRTQSMALAFWGAPIAALALLPIPVAGLAAMVVIGVANAVYDVASMTIFQRGSANNERAAVFSVFEGTVGIGSISGSLLAPVLLAAFGDRGAMAVGGSMLPLLALFIYLRLRQAERIAVVDERIVQLLQAVPVFVDLPLTAVERLAAGLVPATFAAGSALMREGEPGDRYIVVEHGEVDVSVGGRFVNRLGPGSGVGEIALLRRAPRTATVVAVTDVAGYSVGAGTFLAAVAGPSAAATSERIVGAHLARSSGPDRPVEGV